MMGVPISIALSKPVITPEENVFLLQLGAIVRANDPMALENLSRIFGNKITYFANKFDMLNCRISCQRKFHII